MTTPESLRDEFAQVFDGNLSSKGELTIEQLWLIAKFAKYVRLRARNNAAFNNLCNKVFPYASFNQVTKSRADGTTYPGLSIKHKKLFVEVSGEESE